MNQHQICPKCRFDLGHPMESCHACGVVFSKIAQRRSVERPLPAYRDELLLRCHSSGVAARTANAQFRQHIGMLFARRASSVEGRFCSPCVNKHFWTMTTVTLAVGWLGTISFFIAPAYIIMNIGQFASAKKQLAA
jgi:hypothetical protein